MEYVHIATGIHVTSDTELSDTLYRKVQEKPDTAQKQSPKDKTAKKKAK